MKKMSRYLSACLALLIVALSFPLTFFHAGAEDFVPENLLLNGSLVSSKAISMMVSNRTQVGDVTGNRVSADGIRDIINGKENGHTDVYGALDWDPPRYVGLTFALNNSYFIGDAVIDAGYADRSELYDVYAADTEEALYSSASLVASDVEVLNGEAKVKINRTAKFISFVCTEYKDGSMRIRQIRVMTGKPASEFVPENLLLNGSLTSSKAISMMVSNQTQIGDVTGNRVSADGIRDIVNGKANGYTYVMDALGWDPPRYVGLTFALNDSYFIGDTYIDAGYEDRTELYDVYAAETEAALYSPASLIASDVEVLNGSTKVTVNRMAKFISFVCTDCKDGGMRIKQIRVMTGDPDSEFVPENLLETSKSSEQTYHMSATTGAVSQGDRFNIKGALDIATDGDVTEQKPVYDCIDGWEYPIYPGVVYTLSETSFAGSMTLYLSGKVKVYVSDRFDTLYSEANCIAGETVCSLSGTMIELKRKVKYVAIFCVGYADVAEFQLWSAQNEDDDDNDDDDKPQYDTSVAEGGKKVLTIGNSFSENASAYATEIAAAQGHDLLFGYLKYPSCTLEQHIDNAGKDRAVYKFEYTSSKGRFTVKDGQKSFATIREALSFTDWDIIVLQQGSTASEKFDTYLEIGTLADFAKKICPDAEIMLHETWSWGIWDEKEDSRCYQIMANYIAASTMLLDNAKIIHSGLAVEKSRAYYKNHLMFNDEDGGNYQHLNNYGKFVAGAAYVATIFDCDIRQNTFGDGDAAFDGVDLAQLRSIVADAVKNGDAELKERFKDYLDEINDKLFGDPDNFIKRHLAASAGIVQDVKTGAIDLNDRFNAAVSQSGSKLSAAELAIDGDALTSFGVWGALDWEYPKNVGVRYTLDAVYQIDNVVIYAGSEAETVTFDVYAAKVGGAMLFRESNRIGQKVVCRGGKVTLPVNAQVSEIAFVITAFDSKGNTPMIAEFDMEGNDTPVKQEVITWPSVPSGTNLLKAAKATEIIAPGGDYKSTKEYDYRFMDYKTETDLSKLTDGDIKKHYDIWSLQDHDKPGVLYDLGAYYDISHLHAWAGVFESDLYLVNGYRIYASDSLSDLYRDKSLVFSYENEEDTTNECGADVKVTRVRYIAFLVTHKEGGWMLREFAAYGARSADQSEPVEQTSIIEGLEAEYYGVATDNLADPIYKGASANVTALVDGKRDNVEFWGGADVNNSSFVFIYNLYANYDLSGVDIFSYADAIDEEFGVHKGIKSAKVYASKTFAELFNTSPLVLKEGYTSETEPDEESLYSADAPGAWKAARYVAFVFTIGDTQYGACRLEELKVYGKMSAVQDEEEEEVRLPQYIDVKAENGVIARIFALGSSDDLSKLDAHLTAERSIEKEKLDFVNAALDNYNATAVYSLGLVNSSGSKIDTGGRLIRLSILKEEEDLQVACVDDFGAEIVLSGVLGEHLTVETETVRSYALVRAAKAVEQADGGLHINLLTIVISLLGVLAACGIGLSVFFGLKLRK